MIKRYIHKLSKINSMKGVKSQTTLPEILLCGSSTEYQTIVATNCTIEVQECT